MKKNKNSGFTLIELMITLVVVGALLMVGVPSIKSFLRNNKLIASTNELVSAFHIARSEAIKLNTKVSICSSSDGSTCSGSSSWKNGWVVFVDADGDLAGTGAACTAKGTDCLLRIHEGFDKSDLTITGVDNNTAAITSFTFTSRGLPKATNGAARSGVFSICGMDGTSTVDSRAVTLSLSGRVRVSKNKAVDSCP